MTDTKAHAADASDTPDLPPAAQDPYGSDFAPIIRSKIQPPPLRSTTLTRQRLIDRLHEATQSRVTLLVAEAGYGKTTLLADFAARSGQRTLWYRLDPTDADQITWTNYLIAACREVDPAFGVATARLLAHGIAGNVPSSAFLETFAAELAAWTAAPTLLVLDDFHRVDRLAEASQVLYRLIEAAPPWLHIVISTRRRPPLELARLAAANELSEIGSEDLRFTDVETARLFAEGYGTPLDNDIVRAIDQRTRGWAASLALLHGSLRNKSREAALVLTQELSGASTPIYDFLAEEVLAAIPDDVELLLMRASILDSVNVDTVCALFARDPNPRTATDIRTLLEQAEELGLLSRTSRSGEQREMHPLLRDFLATRLKHRFGNEEVRQIHRSVAASLSASDPLIAARHFMNAGDRQEAMNCLESSILKTIGSGRWGLAAELVDGLRDVPPGPGVAAIRARQLMDDGDLAGAERLLESVHRDVADPRLRSALRQTELTLGWRTGDRRRLHAAASALVADPETPAPLREIADMFAEDSGASSSLALMANRFTRMAETQAASGLDFFSAVAMHNASVAFLAAGQYDACVSAARNALSTFAVLPFRAAEALSTHVVAAYALMEAGRDDEAQSHVTEAMGSGREFADVPALLAIAYLSQGKYGDALILVQRARSLEKQGRGDSAGTHETGTAEAFSLLRDRPEQAIALLQNEPEPYGLDLGLGLAWRLMLCHAYLMLGRSTEAAEVASSAFEEATKRGACHSEVRLGLLLALTQEDKAAVAAAVRRASTTSHLALSELADVLCRRLELAELCMPELGDAIRSYPQRWLPLLRQAMGKGAPGGDDAALLLDRFGEQRDVGVLRAYSRTYRGRGVPSALGLALAKRTSPRLAIHDLGRVILEIGDRSVALSGMRRKPAALLLYLVSRTSFTSHREQALDELWPEADPASAINSLNQSLYFLRREIDPWYEDGVSPDYVGFAGDLVWLDAELTTADSAEFLAAVTLWKHHRSGDPRELLRSYTGHFAPEFEYEEWALALRSKLRSTYLETATTAIANLVRKADLEGARAIAALALETDDTASDVERALIWLLWRLGARSAARAQFEHLIRVEQLDGLQTPALLDLVEGPLSLGTQ